MIRRLFYVFKFKIVMKLRVFGCYLAALYLPVPVSASKLAPRATQEVLELAQGLKGGAHMDAWRARTRNLVLAGKCEALEPETI